jgi:hypothetical protein
MLRELKGSTTTKRGIVRARRKRTARTLGIMIFCLVLLGASAGLGYTYYTGNAKPVTPAALPESKKSPLASTNTPKPKAKPEGPVGVSIQVLSSPVAPGSNASVTIRTRPEAACSIKVTYKDQQSNDGGLIPKTADEFGTAQWTWTVEIGRPVGKWPVDITCALGEMSGYVRGDLEIANP